jgi:hypothetical protein
MNIEQYIEKDYNHVLNDLQDYILNKKNIDRFSLLRSDKKNDLNNNNNNNKKNVTPVKTEQLTNQTTKINDITKTFFYPREKDSLFWCFYIMKHELFNYQMLNMNNRNIVFEKTKKIEYVEKIRKEKHMIKNYKFASISNIENNLVNEMKLETFAFLTLCVIENMNVFVIQRNTYYELKMNDGNDVFVIKKNDGDKYGVEMIQKIDESYEKYRNQYYQIENMNKPFKAITYYKVNELVDICSKLCIETTDKKTGKQKSKKELYESIIQNL